MSATKKNRIYNIFCFKHWEFRVAIFIPKTDIKWLKCESCWQEELPKILEGLKQIEEVINGKLVKKE